MASDPWEMPRDPSEAKVWRIAGYRQLTRGALDQVHHDQTSRLTAARIEMTAIVSRWKDVQATIDTLSVTTQEIEHVLLEKRREA
jgi:hypothetical protein